MPGTAEPVLDSAAVRGRGWRRLSRSRGRRNGPSARKAGNKPFGNARDSRTCPRSCSRSGTGLAKAQPQQGPSERPRCPHSGKRGWKPRQARPRTANGPASADRKTTRCQLTAKQRGIGGPANGPAPTGQAAARLMQETELETKAGNGCRRLMQETEQETEQETKAGAHAGDRAGDQGRKRMPETPAGD